ncbi:MAG: SseB family protein [Clostridia bacterium]|nr:SseB family protein [Clostridia bacterium]
MGIYLHYQTKDGKIWNAAFTHQAEYEKCESSRLLSCFIDSSMKFCLDSETDGFVINPWGKSFMLTKDLIGMIFKADGDVEYSVPDDPITRDLLEDGSFLKRAIEICNRNRTQINLIKLAGILRNSRVWVPCTAPSEWNAIRACCVRLNDNRRKDASNWSGQNILGFS